MVFLYHRAKKEKERLSRAAELPPKNPRMFPGMLAAEVASMVVTRRVWEYWGAPFVMKVRVWDEDEVILDKKVGCPIIGPRLGIVNSKKNVNELAVVRSKARRRLTQALNKILPEHAMKRCDYVYILKEGILTETPEALEAEIFNGLWATRTKVRMEGEAIPGRWKKAWGAQVGAGKAKGVWDSQERNERKRGKGGWSSMQARKPGPVNEWMKREEGKAHQLREGSRDKARNGAKNQKNSQNGRTMARVESPQKRPVNPPREQSPGTVSPSTDEVHKQILINRAAKFGR